MCRQGAGHVSFYGKAAVYVDAISGGHAHGVACGFKNMRQHSGCRGFAIGAGDAGDGNAAGRTRREQHFHHFAGNVPRFTLRRRNVHAETGRGIYFYDRAANFLIGLGNVRGEEIHAPDVQSNRLNRPHGHFTIIRVHDIGQIDGRTAGGKIGGGTHVKNLTLR